jgi:antitoxin CptB
LNDRPPAGEKAPPGGDAAALPRSEGQGDELIDQGALNKLKWRCRRGLLENDLFIERFFVRHGARITVRQAGGLSQLMDLEDNDLLDLLLRRREPEGDIKTSEVRQVLEMLRTSGASPDVGT